MFVILAQDMDVGPGRLRPEVYGPFIFRTEAERVLKKVSAQSHGFSGEIIEIRPTAFLVPDLIASGYDLQPTSGDTEHAL